MMDRRVIAVVAMTLVAVLAGCFGSPAAAWVTEPSPGTVPAVVALEGHEQAAAAGMVAKMKAEIGQAVSVETPAQAARYRRAIWDRAVVRSYRVDAPMSVCSSPTRRVNVTRGSPWEQPDLPWCNGFLGRIS